MTTDSDALAAAVAWADHMLSWGRLPVDDSKQMRTLRDAAEALMALQTAMQAIVNVGHSDDCLFCGFKDRKALESLAQCPSAEPERQEGGERG